MNGRRRRNREESRTYVSTIFSLSMGMSRLTQDATAKPISRDQIILRRQRGQRKNNFPFQLTTSKISSLTRLILTLDLCDDHTCSMHSDTSTELVKYCRYGHTYGKSMDQRGKVANPARGQLNRENVFFCFCSRLRFWSCEDGFGSPVPR